MMQESNDTENRMKEVINGKMFVENILLTDSERGFGIDSLTSSSICD